VNCDLCNEPAYRLGQFYGRWICPSCLDHYIGYYDDADVNNVHFRYFDPNPLNFDPRPIRVQVAIDEIECNDNLSQNVNTVSLTSPPPKPNCRTMTNFSSCGKRLGEIEIEIYEDDGDNYNYGGC
jgi:hypothetical protein